MGLYSRTQLVAFFKRVVVLPGWAPEAPALFDGHLDWRRARPRLFAERF